MSSRDPSRIPVSFRLEKELKDDVYRMVSETGVSMTDLVRNLLKASYEFYEENGFLAFPVKVVMPEKSSGSGNNRAAS